MKFPLFLYYELLIRLTIFKPEVGEFRSVMPFDDHVLLKTDRGMIAIPVEIMNMQFNDPRLIPRDLRKKKTRTIATSSVVYHKVTAGQSITAVASKYGVEVQDLRVWNGLKSKTLVSGQKLKIYAKNRTPLKAPSSFLSYKVKTGDTLSEIAEKFDGATVQSIRRDNSLSKAGLQVGMVLKISKG